jgi:hypothetical protein
MKVVGLFKFAHWPVYILLLLVLLSAGCSRGSGLQIVSHDLTARQFTGDLNSTKGMAVVTGIAKNVNTVALTKCTINVRYFDADKNVIGVSSAYKEFLEPGEVWSFAVQLTSLDAWKTRSYDISSTNQ